MTKSILMRSCAFLAMPMLGVVAVPTAALAQQITTSITGQVTNENGAAVDGATVVITDTRTGAARTVTTGADGLFSADNLTTGGPYTITATADGFQGQSVEGVSTSLQGATNLTFALTPSSAEVAADTIVVTAARANISTVSTGPGTSFSEAIMESAPTFGRDVRDVIRLDPRVTLSRDDLSDQDRVSCMGGNDRGNAFTVDGITQSDVYGLNETGFSARTSTPIPYDAVRETQVNFAPFDVEYGQFTGCAINVVTRGGTNRVKAGGFFEVTGDDFQGQWARGKKLVKPDYRDKRWGVSLGGPVIKDKIFLFGAYEQRKSADTVEVGAKDGGYGIELPGVTKANFDTFRTILKNTYGIETGDLPTILPNSNKRWFLRGDFQLNDDNRFEATYQRIKEDATFTDDYFTSNIATAQIGGLNSGYHKGSTGTFMSARLYSQLTDNLSTELRYARSKTIDLQDPIGGGEAQSANPIPRIIVAVTNNGYTNALQAGPGSNRSANDLRNWITQYKAAAKLDLGAHKLKGGVELNKAHIYNLFVSNATGTLVFSSLANLASGILTNGTSTSTSTPGSLGSTAGAFINYTASGDVADAAADFRRNILSTYVQDDWRVFDALDVTLGLRVDMFSGDAPTLNKRYVDRYGFGNDVGFDSVPSVWMPRLSATYTVGDLAFLRGTKIRGGWGKFSGGDPLVWFGNAFQNDGQTFAQGVSRVSSGPNSCPAGPLDVVDASGNFTGFPTCVQTNASNIALAGDARVNSVSPSIKMPTVGRFNLGLESRLNFGPEFLNNWRFNADAIYSRYKDPFSLVDLAQTVNTALGKNGYTIDGRPIYRGIDVLRAGCTAELVSYDPVPVYENVNAACFTTSRDNELMLTNADTYKGLILSTALSKTFRSGVITDDGSVFVNLGYAYQDVEDRRNMYNSTAGSNYQGVAAFDRQNPEATTGFYSQKHNIAASINFTEKFFGDNETQFGMTFTGRSGRPYSLTFSGSGDFTAGVSGSSDNMLAYIPTGIDDPNIAPTSNATAVKQYVDFLNTISCDDDYRGKTIKRNTCRNDWYFDMDLRFSQEIPGPARFLGDRNDKFEIYAMMDNFLNFLDDNWNVFRRRQFQGYQPVVDLASTPVDSSGRYVINRFDGGTFDADNQTKFSSSLWRLKLGMKYNF